MNWLTKTFTALQVLAASELNQFRDNLRLLEAHEHTGASGDGGATLAAASETGYPDEFALILLLPVTQSGTVSVVQKGGVQVSTLNGYVTYVVGLRAGTWRLTVYALKFNDAGIATFSVDGSTIGSEQDLYASSSSTLKIEIDFTVAANGWYEFKMEVTDKNASSSGYRAQLQTAALFVRTGS